MDIIGNLFIAGLIIIAGLLAQLIFRRFRIPEVLLLILFGAVISAAGFTGDLDRGGAALLFLITFSLIYVVFYGALPISIRAIFSTLKFASLSSLANFIAITAVVGLLAAPFVAGWTDAFIIGALFCVLDSSIINSMLEHVRIGKKAEAQIQTESAIIDTIVIVGVLSLVNFSTMSAPEILQSLASYLFLSFGIGMTAAIVWAFVIRKVRDYSSAPIATMAVLVILYAFAEYARANGVITVFSFAIVFGNISLLTRIFYKEQAEFLSAIDPRTKRFFQDISFLIRSFLFVYLGILLDLSQWRYLLIGFAFFIVAYFLRSFLGRLVRNRDITERETHLLDALCAKGLTTTVMIAIVQGSAVFTNIIIGGIFSSVLLSSAMVFFIQKGKFPSASDIILKAAAKMHSAALSRRDEGQGGIARETAEGAAKRP